MARPKNMTPRTPDKGEKYWTGKSWMYWSQGAGCYVSIPDDKTPAPESPDDIVFGIALEVLNIRTLERQNIDSRDFREVFVPNLKKALLLAYEAGRKSR